MIKKTAAGIYNWLPFGLKVVKKVEDIVRKNLDLSGAQEILMPMVQPAELWKESERFDQYGKELLKFQDRSDRDFVLGPTLVLNQKTYIVLKKIFKLQKKIRQN